MAIARGFPDLYRNLPDQLVFPRLIGSNECVDTGSVCVAAALSSNIDVAGTPSGFDELTTQVHLGMKTLALVYGDGSLVKHYECGFTIRRGDQLSVVYRPGTDGMYSLLHNIERSVFMALALSPNRSANYLAAGCSEEDSRIAFAGLLAPDAGCMRALKMAAFGMHLMLGVVRDGLDGKDIDAGVATEWLGYVPPS